MCIDDSLCTRVPSIRLGIVPSHGRINRKYMFEFFTYNKPSNNMCYALSFE